MAYRLIRKANSLICSVLLTASTLVCAPLLAKDNQRQPPPTAEDLRYGTALYAFYQNNYFDALTELKVGEKKGDLPNHKAHAKLLEGGISLAYNMDNTAADIFAPLLKQHLSDEDQARAWFYLARLQFDRGRHTDVSSSLHQIDPKAISDDLHDEFRYLAARSELAAGDHEGAIQMIGELDDADWNAPQYWLAYYHLNHAIEAEASGDWQTAVTNFSLIADELVANTQEARALKNRARLNAGLLLIKHKRYSEATDQLRLVDYRSTSAADALLAWGWAAMQAQNYREALTPFTYLTGFFSADPSVAESYLMVGQIYQKLETPSHAIKAYQKAETYYYKELKRIRDIQSRLTNTSFDELFDVAQQAGDDWFSHADTLPDNANTAWLKPLFHQQTFQFLIKGWQDINKLENNLISAQGRQSSLRYVLDAQKAAFTKNTETQQEIELHDRLQTLQKTYNSSVERFNSAQQTGDGLALASDDEIMLWRLVDRAEKRIQKLAPHNKVRQQQRDMVQRVKGLLVWQAAESYPSRRWQAQKQINEIQALLQEAQHALERANTISRSEHRQKATLELERLETETKHELLQAQTLKARYEKRLKQQAEDALNAQKKRLEQYLLETQLAKARLHDDVLFNGQAEEQYIP
ncbi:Uncharacterised protein [BD1-7 clade bacterium]|uniref:Beta-barrel assembly-enhancing protease n=1 Tax=BD1-7 clade bacterium TaxID=2029982 RepID=A0A5S9P6K1_9GAMM|nr:Uncharacterised protein [BD1-7 clade bacterium]CAA0099217.1 Uncharacterised protein [BD1-7 clade bacterium]